jgi:GxxExxY protein
MADLVLKEEAYAIVGAAMAVYNELGCGFLEQVYQEAFETELRIRNLAFTSQEELRIRYKDSLLDKAYKADLVVFGKVIVEIKVLDRLSGKEEAQVFNYLKASGMELGLLFNFGSHPCLEWKRIIKPRKFAKQADEYR